ncbi:MAG: DUF2232 domain-containing protein [Desulfobulbus sp.]|jgi:uncharacterized protein YybS (DUF2232 family)
MTGPNWKTDFSPPGQILLFSSLFFLPALNPAIFGWFNGLLAVPVFFMLSINGPTLGWRKIRAGLLVAAVGSVVVGGFAIFGFALTSVPLGLYLYQSAYRGETAAISGGKGAVAMAASWLAFWALYGALAGFNPYTELLSAIDQTLEQTREIYTANELDLGPEVVAATEQFIAAARATMPKMLPGLLLAMIALTVWINMLFIATLTRHAGRDATRSWGPYATWRLPDQVIWLLIVGVTTLLIGSGSLRYMGGWLVLLSVILYFFQGLAVLVALLDRWNVPVIARFILYGVLLIQSYSLLILAILGILDIWFNLRPRRIDRPV